MTSSNLTKRIMTSLTLIFLVLIMFNINYFLVFSLLIIGTLSIIEFCSITKKIFTNKVYILFSNFFFISYIFLFCILFFYFSNLIILKIILFTLLLGCVASDIGGYIIGNLIKGPKLTKISPNKTISGAIGSLIFTSLLILSLYYFYTNNIKPSLLIVCLTTSIFCQLGDLFFSYLKRKSKIKDTGNFLPGHGGILDRVDGILFGIPIGFLTLILIY